MPDDEPDGRSFEDVARALFDEVNRAVGQLSAIDLDDIARAANEADHHPDLHVEGYRNVRIVLTTHATGGISQSDVDLARAIDDLAQAKAR